MSAPHRTRPQPGSQIRAPTGAGLDKLDRRTLFRTLAVKRTAPGPVRADADRPGKTRVLQGPMIGWVAPTRAVVWMRLSDEHTAEIEYQAGGGPLAVSRAVSARSEDDYCIVVELEGLEPDTEYHYRVSVNGAPDPYLEAFSPFKLRTAPAGPARFTVAFGSCARFQDDSLQPIWNAVSEAQPDLFFWLGDNIYADAPYAHRIAEDYRRQRNVPTLQSLLRNTPNLAIWDDHDYGVNDQDRRNPIKEVALAEFKRYWANPSYGLDDVPGVFFRYEYGAVDFFFIDGRYYRDPSEEPDQERKTLLGRQQFEWLTAGLAASEAPFKVIVSGIGWSTTEGPGGDAWSAFLFERNRLFDFVVRERVTGVVLLSGDTHVGELNCIPWSEHGGYDLYDFVSSPLAQKPDDRSWLHRTPELRMRQVYFRSNNFGELTFDMRARDPTLTFRLKDTLNHSVWWPLTLTASELRNGVSTWQRKIDAESLQRHAAHARGESSFAAAMSSPG
jgi:alkaline phosphatase D